MPTQNRRTHYWVTFAVLSVSVASYTLMQSLTIPVLSELETEFNTDQNTVTWLLTGYLLSASVFTPIMGRLGDAYGKQRLLVISLAALAIGSLAAALAPTIGLLIVARVIQGVGGGVLPLAFGIIRDEFPREKIGGAVSVVSSLLAVGFGAGIVLAGPITSSLGFRWLFWLPFIVTATAAVVAAVVVPESPVRTPGRIAILPAVLLSAWLVALLLGLSQAPKWGWGDPRTVGLIVVAIVLLVAWIRVELTVDVPLIDMKMMRLPGVWTTNLVALLLGVGMYASFGFIPQFNQTPAANGYGFGSTVTESGLILLPSAIMTFLTGLVAAPIARRIGPKTVVVVGSVIGAIGMFMMAGWHDEPWKVAVSNAVIGTGIGLAFACLAGLIVAAVTPAQTGVASGMNANIRTIGGSIGTAVMASIVTAHFLPSGFPKEIGYTAGFVVLGGALLAAAFAGLMIPSISEKGIEDKLEQERLDRELAVMSA
ncbi:MFS transporter [Aeromicrobium fastidiosum]|uniref:MFS transporter n=1 Tax=Aeromicrobium fastidiosum TaxID=52699 RepID=UPI001D7943E9|nr:MFS transporter [Aeromicrobium fastidiosum]MBP2390085.1 EmrB/QacA subfamily drug resistance transporter [Aeromicrobium fastidiosum]